jgi:hypothetical protein
MNEKIVAARPFGTRGFVNGETLHSRWAATQKPFGTRETPPKGRGCAPQRAAKIPEFRTAEVVDFELRQMSVDELHRNMIVAQRHLNIHVIPRQHDTAKDLLEILEAELKQRP